MTHRNLQYGFAEQYGSAAFNRAARQRKAMKVIAILKDAIGPLESRSLLDIGCSTGYMTCNYADHFGRVVGTDIDFPALLHASAEASPQNLSFAQMDSQRLAFDDEQFDVVTCTHIYEHVPNARLLMAEIRRVLRPGGVCFFSAGNRLSLIEPHYRLPLLSVMPKTLAHLYLRLLGRGSHYYENHLTYWGLKRLVTDFDVQDYTITAVESPLQFHADDVVVPGSRKRKIALIVLRLAYWVCPTYLWVLRKKG